MFERIWVTSRRLSGDFWADFLAVAKSGIVDKILLREADLNEIDYENLAKEALKISNSFGVGLILHSHFKVAKELGVADLHLPFKIFLNFNQNLFRGRVGVSVHSSNEALLAQNLGANYVVAGHIFDTLSHANLAGLGVDFLKHIVKNLTIPAYAIGGIDAQNIDLVRQSGANGAYMMREILKQIKEK